jgi:DNA repair exonuclease SbcCD nuclease subunit
MTNKTVMKFTETDETLVDKSYTKTQPQFFKVEPEFEYDFPIYKECVGGISIIAIGDPHFKLANLTTIQTYMTRVISSIQQVKPSFVVILGDLLHEHEKIHTKVLNYAYDFIHRIRQLVKVFVIVGNHDYINNQQYLSSNHWMNAMKEWDNVTIVDSGAVHETPSGKFILCPYVFPGRFHEALNQIDPEWKDAKIIFCHQEIYGCKMGAIVSTIGDKWDTSYPMVVSGHIHDKQRIQENVFYTGSSIQHAFGESHDKTISICTIEKNLVVEKINLGLVAKKIVYASVDDMNSFDKLPVNGDQLRITLSGSVDEFKTFRKTKKYKDLVGGGIKIVYKAKPMQVEEGAVDYQKKSFETILYDMIETSGNNSLKNLYRELVQ